MNLTTSYWGETTSSDVNSSVTVTSSSMNYKNYNEWMTAVISMSLLLASSVYLLTTLSVHEYHMMRRQKQYGSCSRDEKYKPSDWMRWLCLTASVFILLRAILVLLEISLGEAYSAFCNGAVKMYSLFLAGAVSCTYLVLWLRQRLFYQSAQLKYLYSKSVRVFSASVVVIMMTSMTFTLALFLFTRGYAYSPNGCALTWSAIPASISVVFVYIFQLLFQLILLGLFFYPLFKQRSLALSVQADITKTMHVIKIVAIATVFVIASTGLAGLSILTLLGDRYGPLIDLVYGMDSYVSLLSVIFSFEDWRERLFAFTIKEDETTSIRNRRRMSNFTTGSSMVL